MPFERSSLHAASDGDETYQLDVVVSLFAIMLVVLVALAASALSGGETRLAYRPHDRATTAYTLRSIEVPYSYRRNWILSDNRLIEIDNAAVAGALIEAFERGASGFSAGPVDAPIDAEVELGDAAGTYRLALTLPAEPRVGGVISRIVSIDDDDALANWASEPGGVVVIVTPGGLAGIARVSQSLDQSRRPHSLDFARRNQLVLTRNSGNFAYDGILRAY